MRGTHRARAVIDADLDDDSESDAMSMLSGPSVATGPLRVEACAEGPRHGDGDDENGRGPGDGTAVPGFGPGSPRRDPGGEATASERADNAAATMPLRFLTVVARSNSLGVACFDAVDASVRVAEVPIPSSGPAAAISLAVSELRPRMVGAPLRCTDAFAAAVRAAIDELNQENGELYGADGGPVPEVEVFWERASVFAESSAAQRISLLQLPGSAGRGAAGRMDLMRSRMQFGRREQVRALGALVVSLVRRRLVNTLEDDAESTVFAVSSVAEVPLGRAVKVAAPMLRALGVFGREAHPSAAGIGKAKEGMSLFAHLNRTRTAPGRRVLREWLLAPTRDLEVLEARQDAIDMLADPHRRDLASQTRDALRYVRDVPAMIRRIELAAASHGDWGDLFQTLVHARHLQELWREHVRAPKAAVIRANRGAAPLAPGWAKVRDEGAAPGPGGRADDKGKGPAGADIAIVARLEGDLDPSLVDLAAALHETVDFDETKIRGAFTVRRGIDAQLDFLRDTYDKMGDFLTEVAVEQMKLVPEDVGLERLHVVYFPQVGYVVALPLLRAAPPPHREPGEPKLDPGTRAPDGGPGADGGPGGAAAARAARLHGLGLGFEYQFSGEDNEYWKSDVTRELDRRIGDIHGNIADLECARMRELSSRILARTAELQRAGAVLAEVDALLSLATVSAENGYVRPRYGTDENGQRGALEIIDGRHPLLEVTAPAYIPATTQLGEHGGAGRCALVMGPNFSGKSAYLKQVGLLAILAHVGCRVPASSATIGTVSSVCGRMMSEDSAAGGAEGTFAGDVSQVSRALRGADADSLVLLDEFGKGTEPADGCALLAAVVGDLASRGARCPRVLTATHFSEILDHGLVDDLRGSLRLLVMDVLAPEQEQGQRQHRSGPGGSVTFLYTVSERNPRSGGVSSYGVHCASIAGVPREVVERASQVTAQVAAGENISWQEIEPAHTNVGAADVNRREEEEGDSGTDEQVIRTLLKWDILEKVDVASWLAAEIH